METRIVVTAFVLCAASLCGATMTDRIAVRHAVKLADVWHGGRRTVFDFEGYEAWIVEPPSDVPVAKGCPWTWTMQWRDAFVPRTGVPQLLKTGWHHATVETFKDRMDETGLAVSRRFQNYLVNELGLAPKACLIGMSWGGFFSVRYAERNSECVSKIYLDCPFLDLGGCCKPLDVGPWAKETVKDWSEDPRMPINMAAALARAKIPILLAYGGADNVLDPKRNAEVFIPRFKEAGGSIHVKYRSAYGHHPHGFEESETTVKDFFVGKDIR